MMANTPDKKRKRRANELDGKTWTRYSISVWSDIVRSAEESNLGHPALFPLALANRLIEIFTNQDDRVVLDPFAGVGTTIIAAQRQGKHGIGIELSSAYAEIARTRCAQPDMFGYGGGQAIIHTGSALNVLDYVAPQSIDLVVTSPPYWDILNQKRTADYKDTRHYGNSEGDLSTISDYHEFLAQLGRVFEQVHTAMRDGTYCCVVVMDLRKKDRFYPYHSDLATALQAIGFLYDDLIIWDRRQEYNNMRPLGYPSVFRVNKAHEFILIFKKRRAV